MLCRLLVRACVPLLILFSGAIQAAETHRPIIIFDLDHTLVDTNYRIAAILRDLGRELDLPQLLDLQHHQIESLKERDFAALKGLDSKFVESLIGDHKDGTFQTSLFGKRFCFDASYLPHDGLIPGGPEFVERLALALDADIVYLTGRPRAQFQEGTMTQLAYFNYPGFGRRAHYRQRTDLFLRPVGFSGSVDDFKMGVISELVKKGPIVAIYDDSTRNVNRFRRELPPETVIVRLNHNVSDTEGLAPGIDQISNYLFNTEVDASGHRKVTLNARQLDEQIARAKKCAGLLKS